MTAGSRLGPGTAAIAAVFLCLTPLEVPAQSPAQSPAEEKAEALLQTKQQIEAAREERRKLATERERLAEDLSALRSTLVTLAQDTQEREAIMTNLERQLDQLTEERERRAEDLRERNEQLAGTLSALARLSRAPSQSVLFQPGGVLKAVRGAHLLETSIPSLRNRAEILSEQISALNAVEQDIFDKLAELSQAENALKEDRDKLAAAIAEKNTLLARMNREVENKNRRIAELVNKATSLEDLVRKLNAGRAAPPAAESAAVDEAPADQSSVTLAPSDPAAPPRGLRPFPVSGQITPPARGAVVQRYGQDAGFGQTSKGIVIRTRPSAQIIAPFDGKVAFAGQFQDLGLILIIEHSDGYHSVLSGMSRLDAATGQWILAGEPVGVMAADQTSGNVEDNPAEQGLYVELRRDGQPVNPLRWISG